MELQIGFDDFGKVREKGLNFVDKTLFIKEVLDNKNTEVSVITRPRRFGKTFNLSTLHHFLASEVNQQKTEKLFDDLKISTVDDGSYMQHQGKFPVIFVSFKGIKETTFQGALKSLQMLIQEMYRTHRYLISSSRLEQDEKELIKAFLSGKTDQANLEGSLKILCELLCKHSDKKVYLLIDEYDTPIQAGYLNGYYSEIINLMRGMFGAALKSNPSLDRAVITGILRVAKESLFSGLNNVRVYSLFQPQYSQHFGFTEEEVRDLLIQANLGEKEPDVKKWYNGYVFGGTTVYNPWSIANYFGNRGSLQPYWVNTSDNHLIKTILVRSSIEFKKQFELLLQDKAIVKIIDENMVFGDLRNNSQAAWSLLMMSGYLKAVSATLNERGNLICECAIPNWEIRALYCNIIESWLGNGHGMEWYQSFLTHLLCGDVEKFTESFGQILAQTISVYDVAHNPEAFYHGFLLGLAAGLDQNRYEFKSNRESGAGRYDIAIIPKDISKTAIILEIKSIVPPKASKQKLPEFLETVLVKEAQKALEQINRNQYTFELVQRGITNIVKIGLAFSGKNFRVASEKITGGTKV
jgi:hypothetical protein